jgi:hypothetical protein
VSKLDIRNCYIAKGHVYQDVRNGEDIFANHVPNLAHCSLTNSTVFASLSD